MKPELTATKQLEKYWSAMEDLWEDDDEDRNTTLATMDYLLHAWPEGFFQTILGRRFEKEALQRGWSYVMGYHRPPEYPVILQGANLDDAQAILKPCLIPPDGRKYYARGNLGCVRLPHYEDLKDLEKGIPDLFIGATPETLMSYYGYETDSEMDKALMRVYFTCANLPYPESIK